MNRRNAIRAAIGGIVAAVMPWEAKPVTITFNRSLETTITNIQWTPINTKYARLRDGRPCLMARFAHGWVVIAEAC